MGEELRQLAEAGLRPSAVGGAPLDVAGWAQWPWDVVWELPG